MTDRQHLVLEALREGKPNKAIAFELKIHESTVKVHVRNIMKKLGARNRTQVAYLASTQFPALAQWGEDICPSSDNLRRLGAQPGVALKQNEVLERLVPGFDLASGLGMKRRHLEHGSYAFPQDFLPSGMNS